MDLELIEDGVIEFGEKKEDWILDGEVELPKLFLQDDVRYEYHQGKTNHCTIYGPLGAISDLMNKEFTAEEIADCLEFSFTQGKPRENGWLIQLGVKAVCAWWNKNNPGNKVSFYRMDVLSNNFVQALKSGYTLVVGYMGSGQYNMDYYADAKIDGVSFGPATYGHCTTSIFRDIVTIKDSYKGRTGKGGIPTNYYGLADIVTLVKNRVYFPSAYIIMKEDNLPASIEEIKRLNSMKLMVEQNIENNSKLRHETKDDMFKDWLHECNNILRDKQKDIQSEMTKFKL